MHCYLKANTIAIQIFLRYSEYSNNTDYTVVSNMTDTPFPFISTLLYLYISFYINIKADMSELSLHT